MSEQLSKRLKEFEEANGEHASKTDFLLAETGYVKSLPTLSPEEKAAYYKDPPALSEGMIDDLRQFGVRFVDIELPGEAPGYGPLIYKNSLAAAVVNLYPDDEARFKGLMLGLDDYEKGQFYENWGETLGIPEQYREQLDGDQ